MKRSISALLAALLAVFFVAVSAAEDAGRSDVYGFDFSFHLNADAFPAEMRDRVSGYASLVNLLRMQGTLQIDAQGTFDLTARIIPMTDESASLSFRAYGIPSNIALTSPLFGDLTLRLHMRQALEFALKTFSHLGIPLQFPTLCIPFVHENAFASLRSAWETDVLNQLQGDRVSPAAVEIFAENIKRIARDDPALHFWISAVGIESGYDEALMAELDALPAYVTDTLTAGGGFRVSRQEGAVTWSSGSATLFEQLNAAGSQSWRLNLPPTIPGGYALTASCQRTEGDQSVSCSFQGQADSEENGLLIRLESQVADWPLSLDTAIDSRVNVRLTGALLPNLAAALLLRSAENGSLTVSLVKPVQEGSSPVEIVTATGQLSVTKGSSLPWNDPAYYEQFINAFSMNDATLNDFVRRVTRPAFTGLLSFLNTVPAEACQSFMNDLTDSGILSLLFPEA